MIFHVFLFLTICFCKREINWSIPQDHRDEINTPKMYLIDAFYMHFMYDT